MRESLYNNISTFIVQYDIFTGYSCEPIDRVDFFSIILQLYYYTVNQFSNQNHIKDISL